MAWWQGGVNWVIEYQSNLIWSLVVLVFYLSVSRKLLPKLETNIEKTKLKSTSAIKGVFAARVLVATLSLSLLLLAWGIDFSGLLVLSTSILTVTGVALFASWSLLSNITAYFILLTNVAYRRGNFVRILDGDNYIEGYIADVGPFSTRLLTTERETLMYPNNLILTRPVLINPKQSWGTMGKVGLKSTEADTDSALPTAKGRKKPTKV
ncbi:MAG TPA: mechanosensitive ion channel protein MscS [Alteromonas australica]|uniref:Small-conductance mechanosensitive channel n=1 Tax=Alteromonas australica TaxID=589873 RepID=A0A358DWX6_9ALTE|nr:mechanosensitive ion channel family protein [Alteromonas australica]MAB94096.1 mechanosensitive ion channel protein MscS [Alteromonas sp.]MBU35547.1 mechanosensitive ion channel protein MscS [Alteromonas sp.]HAI73557.1 mechanosensitive ion channel protein MscS [Alteromonas australica]HAU25898.1 mechanosensitive ion channel protein MscS [Alteromonas australica]HAW78167.1 mechanosensitive ion channel protein MscS [Alteromonas australica]|tara:strand:+ start:98 stop:724 length:627 start_codon:yes stop_codon:yes gene_type:complete